MKIASHLQPKHWHLTLDLCLALPTNGRTPLAFPWSGPTVSALASACAVFLGSVGVHHVGLLSASQRIRPTWKQAGGRRGVYCCPGSGENATRPATCRSPIFCTHLFWSSVKLCRYRLLNGRAARASGWPWGLMALPWVCLVNTHEFAGVPCSPQAASPAGSTSEPRFPCSS